jgi:heptosyltransferase III
MEIPKNIIISRTDSIGDMVLALPIAAVLKQHFPDMTIGYMGRPYTKAIIEACSNIDTYIDQDEFMKQPITLGGESPQCILHVRPRPELAKRAKELKIPYRIGTTNRIFHWLTCNKLVKLSRKNSDLHEAQLNLKLLEPFGIKHDLSFQEIADSYGLDKFVKLPDKFKSLIDTNKFNLILHPKSQGNGREWDLNHYISLIEMLDSDKFQIFVSGTDREREKIQPLIDKVGHRITNIIGLMSLSEFIAFIAACDGLVASGTGPVHIGAALQKHTLGIYPPIRPLHPGRWQPIGKHAKVFVLDKTCNDCRNDNTFCACTFALQPIELKNHLESIYLTR